MVETNDEIKFVIMNSIIQPWTEHTEYLNVKECARENLGLITTLNNVKGNDGV